MKNFVITIRENARSIAAATRCITSGKKYGIDIEFHEAYTPKTFQDYIDSQKINVGLFNNSKHSREDNAKAAFCSHFSLWQKCLELNEEITIFEHDAVIVDYIPNMIYNGCISLGHPSYGRYNMPKLLGTNRLTSKQYFPGAHAYRLKPIAAQYLIDQARLQAAPTDIFLNIATFPFLEEYFPWPVIVKENFSTIQKEHGCTAKHMYNEDYVIEEV